MDTRDDFSMLGVNARRRPLAVDSNAHDGSARPAEKQFSPATVIWSARVSRTMPAAQCPVAPEAVQTVERPYRTMRARVSGIRHPVP